MFEDTEKNSVGLEPKHTLNNFTSHRVVNNCVIACRELKRWNFQSNLRKDHLEGDRMGEGMVGGLFTKLNEK